MIKVTEIQTETSAMGSTRPADHPNYFVDQFVTTITFTTNKYPDMGERELLIHMLEQYLEISQNLAKQKPITEYTQVK